LQFTTLNNAEQKFSGTSKFSKTLSCRVRVH